MKIILILAVVLNQLCLAQVPPASLSPPYKRDEVVFGNSRFTTAKFFPDEMATFELEVKAGDDLHAAQLALVIIEKCKAKRAGVRQPRNQPHDEADAYINAWANALRLWSVTTNASAQAIIMQAWKADLVDSPEVIDQVRALNFAPIRAFLDQNFWNLYATTPDLELLASMGYVISFNGNDHDIQHVESRLNSVKSRPQTPATQPSSTVSKVPLDKSGRERYILGTTLTWYGFVKECRTHPPPIPKLVLSPAKPGVFQTYQGQLYGPAAQPQY